MQVEQPSNKATNNENTSSDQNNQVNKTDSNKKNIVVKKSG